MTLFHLHSHSFNLNQDSSVASTLKEKRTVRLQFILYFMWMVLLSTNQIKASTSISTIKKQYLSLSDTKTETALDRENSAKLYQQSIVALESNKLTKAHKFIVTAIKLKPQNANYHFQKAMVLSALAEKENLLAGLQDATNALISFKKAIVLEPNNIRFLQGLMGFYLLAPRLAGGSEEKAQQLAKKIAWLHTQHSD